jgi:hypothetical protein
MFHRNALLLVAGAAMFLDASAVSAQDSTRTRRPTSSKRIPIGKESPGEVVPPRVDTVTIYRTDTLRLRHVDTVTRTNTVTRIDTVVQTVNLLPRMVGGWYFGLAGGAAIPTGAIKTVNSVGGLGQFQVGWQGFKQLLGGRFDGSYTQYGNNSDACFAEPGTTVSCPNGFSVGHPSLWNFNLDAKLDIPGATHWFGSGARFTPYLLGGGSYVYYRNLRMKLDEGITGGFGPHNAVIAGGPDNWLHNWGWMRVADSDGTSAGRRFSSSRARSTSTAAPTTTTRLCADRAASAGRGRCRSRSA